ncbi:hypothetical protein GOP47_0028190 [Adiantum capillus-veneris]|nr:hypothetical protein GOP47_0028190 [Adiantum capillus-veneris]
MDSDGVPDELMSALAGSNSSSSHGWQKVVNTKKAKRQQEQAAAKTVGSGGRNTGINGSDSRVFHTLEKEAEQKRAHKEAILRAYHQDLATSSGATINSESDDDAADLKAAMIDADLEKKPKVKKPKKPKITVLEAASAIDADNLASFLAEISELFATSPGVQLMRFADYFGRAFSLVTPTQFGWNKILKESSLAKAVEVPLCFVPESIVKIASDWVATKPLDALCDFLIWALADVLSDMLPTKGSKSTVTLQHKTKVGVLVVLALVLRKRSDTLFHSTTAIRTNTQFLGQEKLVFLAWAYGQAAQGDLVAGMQAWVQNLLPLACGKASTPASRDLALQFAESILFCNTKKATAILQNGALRKGERLVPPASLDALLHAAFPSDASRTKATERFEKIYPLVKELALYGPSKSKSTRAVAQQLLPLCLESASKDVLSLSSEACSIFVWCLTENPDCFKQWEKLYLEKLKGSVKVLGYMCKDWSAISGKLAPMDELWNTITIIQNKNHAAMKGAKADPKLEVMLITADRHAKVLKRKSARMGPCFKMMASVMAGASIVYGFYLLNFDLPAVM